jgi:hypothetical protein
MTLERCDDSTGLCIPYNDCAIMRATGESLAIGGEAHRVHPARMLHQGIENLLPALGIPDDDSCILSTAGDSHIIWGYGN